MSVGKLRVVLCGVMLAVAFATGPAQGAVGMRRGGGARPPARFRRWGVRMLRRIYRSFSIPGSPELAGFALRQGNTRRYRALPQPAAAWDDGVMLMALSAAARHSGAWRVRLHAFVRALGNRWRTGHGVGGYNVGPGHTGLDRYYDDNAWLVLGLVSAYNATGDRADLRQARRTLQFVLSGESRALGGGIFWHEQDKKSKNTCSNAPAIAGALRLYQATHQQRYMRIAQRLYRWVNSHLRDPQTGLYYDNETLGGRIDRQEWSYNAAMMLQANCLFFRCTHEQRYLRRAQDIARAAQERWLPQHGSDVGDSGRFTFLLLQALGMLYRTDHRRRWLTAMDHAIRTVHRKCANRARFYGPVWRGRPGHLHRISLINQAAVAAADLQAGPVSRRRH